MNNIPVANPKAGFLAQEDEIMQAIRCVLHGGRYILGNEVKAFEREFADYIGAGYCCGVASGTDALLLALKGLGIHAGDEVITVSHSAVATVAAVELCGAEAVLADIDPITRCIDPNLIGPLITPKTKALIPVHVYGQPAPMEKILAIAKRHHLFVIEDCAQAHGAKIAGRKVGTFGEVAIFSFYPTKNLGALGDGGAIVTNDEGVFNSIHALREYGWKEHYISSFPGFNSRLDELQAAVLRVKLKNLDRNNAIRISIADSYRQACSGTPIQPPAVIPGTTHVMHLFVVECDERDRLRSYLKQNGVDTGLHYTQAIHQQPAYLGRLRGGENLPNTENLYRRIVSLPIYPELEKQDIEHICSLLRLYNHFEDIKT